MALRIDVQIDNAQLLLRLEKGHKRLAYGVVNAINSTAKLIQKTEREHVLKAFTVRKADFIRREAAKLKFASVRQNRPFAEIYVGQKSRLLLSVFEEGGVKAPVKGRRVAVPKTGEAARPSFGQPVPAAYRFTQLRLTKTRPLEAQPSGGRKRVRRSKSTGSGVRYGERGTYQIPDVGVFQRLRGEEESTLIYPFVEQPRLDDRLRFEETARQVADQWFGEFMEREVTQALLRVRT